MSKDSHFTGQSVYSQVLKLLDKEKILQISRETKGSEAYAKRFDGFQHLVVMLFGILKHFDSLRELEIGMKAEAHKLGHLGMDYLVRRSTLAEANIRRPQEFFASVYAYLLEKYAKFLADSRPAKSYKGQTHEPKDWEKLLYMMDSTTITLFDNILERCRAAPEIRQEERRPELITIAITDKWLPSAHILQLLAVGGAFIPVTNLYTNLIISKGKSNIFMWNTIAQGMVQLITMYLLYPYGIHTMLAVYVAVNIAWLGVWHYFVWREIRLGFFHALKDIFSFGIIAAAVMAGVAFITRPIENIYLLALAKILSAAALYIIILWASGSVTFKESLQYLLKKKA